MKTKYTVDYFLKKFKAKNNWTTGEYVKGSHCCALGHCGVRDDRWTNPESDALRGLFDSVINEYVIDVNDGDVFEFNQPTPKARILAALKRIKKCQKKKKVTKTK